ncbi:MAG TPA: hypothetical protein VH877_32295 [Polyangia bacterium]|jgi:hypothetical protein|nr:hypothetical protein [Polyangia bacterium]
MSTETATSRTENPRPAPPTRLVGRETLLAVLHAGMQGSAGKPWVLVGPDGIGKSALAAAYAKRYAGDYDVLWWVDAASPVTLARDLYDLGLALEVETILRDKPHYVRQALRKWLNEHPRWLLVFDGAPDPEALRSQLPEQWPGHVLITSASWPGAAAPDAAAEPEAAQETPKEPAAPSGGASGKRDPLSSCELLHIPPLEPAEAQALLQSGPDATEEEQAACRRIASLLVGTPLALHAAACLGAPIEVAPVVSQLLDEMYEGDREPDEPAADAEEATCIAWYLAMRRMKVPSGGMAVGFFAIFGPHWMPEMFVIGLAHLFAEEELARQAIDAAVASGLLERGPAGLRLQPAWCRETLAGFEVQQQEHLIAAAIMAVGETTAGKGIGPEQEEVWVRITPGLLELADHIRKLPSEPIQFLGHTLRIAALALETFNEYALAALVMERAVGLLEPEVGEGEVLARFLADDARVLGHQAETVYGDARRALATKARTLYERALALSEAAFGADTIEVGRLHYNRGMMEQALYENKEAVAHLTRAVAIAAAHPGQEELQEALCAHRLGECLARSSQFTEAAAALRQAIAAERKATKPEPGYLAVLYTDLAHALEQADEFEEARAALLEAIPLGLRSFQTLERREYGDYYQLSLRYWRLAQVLEQLDDDAGARGAYENALAAKGLYSSDDDLEVGHLHEALGDLFRRGGELAQAEHQYLAAHRVFSKEPVHFQGLAGLVSSKLGEVAFARHDLETARRHYLEAARLLDSSDDDFDVDWHDWPQLRCRMASLALQCGDLAEARSELTRASEWIEEHEDDLIHSRSRVEPACQVMIETGDAWHTLGDLAQAWSLYGTALSLAESVLGEEDPMVAKIRTKLSAGRGVG